MFASVPAQTVPKIIAKYKIFPKHEKKLGKNLIWGHNYCIVLQRGNTVLK